MNTKLWVITLYFECEPKLEVWSLKEIRKTCYIVDHRGTNKVLMRGTTGRHYFLSEEECEQFLRKWIVQEMSSANRKLRRMAALHGAGRETLLDYAKGKEEAQLLIDKASL